MRRFTSVTLSERCVDYSYIKNNNNNNNNNTQKQTKNKTKQKQRNKTTHMTVYQLCKGSTKSTTDLTVELITKISLEGFVFHYQPTPQCPGTGTQY